MADPFIHHSLEIIRKHVLTQGRAAGLSVGILRRSNLVLFPHNFSGCLNTHDQAHSLKNRKVKMQRKYTLVPVQELHAGIRRGEESTGFPQRVQHIQPHSD